MRASRRIAAVVLAIGMTSLISACLTPPGSAQPPYRGGYGTSPWYGYYGQTVIVDPGYWEDEPIATALPQPPPDLTDVDIPDIGMPVMGGVDF